MRSPQTPTTGLRAMSRLWTTEPHGAPIYSLAFNQTHASHLSLFATVGANRINIYRLEENDGQPPATHTVPVASSSSIRLEALQAYVDEDPAELFYCCIWGVHERTAHALLAVAGKMGTIRVLDCHRGHVHTVLQGHGGAVHELCFHPCQHALLFSASADGSVRLWHILARDCVAVFAGHEVKITPHSER